LGTTASVCGGFGNVSGLYTPFLVSSDEGYNTISGGRDNLAVGFSSSVSGGQDNVASGVAASVSGGQDRSVSGDHDWRAGGQFEDD